MDADEIARVLSEHGETWSVCECGLGPHAVFNGCDCGAGVPETAYLEHLATILAPLVEQARQEGAREAFLEVDATCDRLGWGDYFGRDGSLEYGAALRPGPKDGSRIEGFRDWLNDRAERAATPGSECACPNGFGGAFRFHRHPCPWAGEVETPGSGTAGGGT
jgi:hypothetical protein